MKFVAGTPEDAAAVAALIARFHELLIDDPTDPTCAHFLASVDEAAQRRYLGDPRWRYLLARIDGQLVGFIAMRDGTHLFHLFVAPEHQGKRLASRLWQKASRGTAGPFTVNASLRAIPVYAAWGFRPTGAVVHAHGIRFQPMSGAMPPGAA